jgi:hypothetical protein
MPSLTAHFGEFVIEVSNEFNNKLGIQSNLVKRDVKITAKQSCLEQIPLYPFPLKQIRLYMIIHLLNDRFNYYV